MMQFHKCRKREMMSSIRLQHYEVTSCQQRHLIEKIYRCKGVSTCYNHRKFGKVSFITEGVIAFSKKVHVFLRHPVVEAPSPSDFIAGRLEADLLFFCFFGSLVISDVVCRHLLFFLLDIKIEE